MAAFFRLGVYCSDIFQPPNSPRWTYNTLSLGVIANTHPPRLRSVDIKSRPFVAYTLYPACFIVSIACFIVLSPFILPALGGCGVTDFLYDYILS
jgi:hypothetical protein